MTEEPTTKRKRPDRIAKLKLRKTTKETVVKTTLLNYLIGDLEFKNKFTNAIKNRVLAYSKRINMASLALNDIIKKSFDKVDINEVELPEIFDQTFIRQLILGTEGTSKTNQLSQYFKENPSYLCNEERHFFDRNIYSSGTIKYIIRL
jgi:hypothetical protein